MRHSHRSLDVLFRNVSCFFEQTNHGVSRLINRLSLPRGLSFGANLTTSVEGLSICHSLRRLSAGERTGCDRVRFRQNCAGLVTDPLILQPRPSLVPTPTPVPQIVGLSHHGRPPAMQDTTFRGDFV